MLTGKNTSLVASEISSDSMCCCDVERGQYWAYVLYRINATRYVGFLNQETLASRKQSQ
jgi:hypothetical protein